MCYYYNKKEKLTVKEKENRGRKGTSERERQRKTISSKKKIIIMEYSTMVALPLLVPEIQVKIQVRTNIISKSNQLYRLCYTNNTSLSSI